MPLTYFQTDLIAAGYNVAQNSLTNIESIKPNGDTYYFVAPQVIPHGSPGVRRGRLNGVGYRAGYSKVDWIFAVLTYLQYDYLKTTYCSGGYSGQVTIYTRVSGLTYARYNAVIDVPETDVIQNGFFAPHPVPIHFTHLVPL